MRSARVLIIVLGGMAFGGCGGNDVSGWVGTWSTTGTQSTTCSGATGTTQLSGTVIIAAGTKGGTITTNADNCTLTWDVAGSTATLESGQMCTVSVGGSNVTVTWTQSTATLNGTITLNTTGETNNGCSFMQQGTLTKMP